MIENAPVVKRGDIITLVARSQYLFAMTKGEVQEKGGLGEWIKVKNISSQRIIYGRVQDSNTVIVEF
jgi:flagella basal body P-ring formation protein FlgA